jgi:hypothetical protein
MSEAARMATMNAPTHAKIDGNVHVVASVEESSYGSAHSHRVRFGCGMLFDVRGAHQFIEHAVAGVTPSNVDEEKLRKAAQDAQEVADKCRNILLELLAEENPETTDNKVALAIGPIAEAELNYNAAYSAAAEATARFHAARTPAVHQRWVTTDKKVAYGCQDCMDFEAGVGVERAAPLPVMRIVRWADIPTGISCPDCGTEIRIRRNGEGAACIGGGHEYTFPEVQQVAVGLLKRLATGELFAPKKEG